MDSRGHRSSLSPLIPTRPPQKFIEHHIGFLNTWMGLSDPEGSWKWVDGSSYELGYK